MAAVGVTLCDTTFNEVLRSVFIFGIFTYLPNNLPHGFTTVLIHLLIVHPNSWQ